MPQRLLNDNATATYRLCFFLLKRKKKKKQCLTPNKFQMLVIYRWHTEGDKRLKEDRGVRFPSLDTHHLWAWGCTRGMRSKGEFLFCAAIGICHWLPKKNTHIRNTRRASPGGQSLSFVRQNQSEKSMKAKGPPGCWVFV